MRPRTLAGARAVPLFAVLFAPVVALVAALSSGPAAALSESEAEALFLRYQKSIAAAERCYEVDFDKAQQQAMMEVINAAVENKIGAKRLRLNYQAKQEVYAMLPSQSCRGAKIVPLLELFERDLRPALAGM